MSARNMVRFLYDWFIVRTKYNFVQFSTRRTFLYEICALFNYLIYSVINTELHLSARKHKNILYF